jgi:hypothetical protein
MLVVDQIMCMRVDNDANDERKPGVGGGEYAGTMLARP